MNNSEQNPGRDAIRHSIYQVIVLLILIVFILCIAIFIFNGRMMALKTLWYTLPVILMYGIFAVKNVDLFCDSQGAVKTDFQAANVLTALRIVLVPPVLLFLFNGYLLIGLILYSVGAVTDVLDGFVARWFNQETKFGLLTDPVGDIVSTFSVFTYFIMEEDIPLWLYVVLAIRYLHFFGGILLLYRRKKHLDVKATITGKLVGLVQAVGIVIILSEKIFIPVSFSGRINRFLFPVLGIAFGSVIVSQTIIGWERLLRNKENN